MPHFTAIRHPILNRGEVMSELEITWDSRSGKIDFTFVTVGDAKNMDGSRHEYASAIQLGINYTPYGSLSSTFLSRGFA